MTEHAPSHVPLSARCPWVDAARVLAIAFVAVAHLYLGGAGPKAYEYISGAAVGLFFYISGYFAKSTNVSSSLLRTLYLFVCYALWATFNLCLSKHFSGITGEMLWHNLWFQGGVYWFLRYLCAASLAAIVYSRLPGIARLATLVYLFYVGSCWFVSHTVCHPFHVLELSLFAFFCGVSSQKVSLPRLGEIILPIGERFMAYAMVALLALAIFAIAASLGRWDIGPQVLLCMLLGWGLLALCRASSIVLPRICATVAAAGPAAVLFYLIHHPIIRVYTSAWIQFTGDFPPVWFDVLFLVSALVACTWLTGKLRGKNRITDIIFFAR